MPASQRLLSQNFWQLVFRRSGSSRADRRCAWEMKRVPGVASALCMKGDLISKDTDTRNPEESVKVNRTSRFVPCYALTPLPESRLYPMLPVLYEFRAAAPPVYSYAPSPSTFHLYAHPTSATPWMRYVRVVHSSMHVHSRKYTHLTFALMHLLLPRAFFPFCVRRTTTGTMGNMVELVTRTTQFLCA